MNAVGYIPFEEESHLPIGLSAEGFVDAIRDVWVGAPAGRATLTTLPRVLEPGDGSPS